MGCAAKVLEKRKKNEGTVEGQTNKGGPSTDRCQGGAWKSGIGHGECHGAITMWGTWAELDGRRMPVPSCRELELGTDWDWRWSRIVDAPTQRNHSTIWVEHEQREWGKVVSVSHKISSRVVANPQRKPKGKSRECELLQRCWTMAFIVIHMSTVH